MLPFDRRYSVTEVKSGARGRTSNATNVSRNRPGSSKSPRAPSKRQRKHYIVEPLPARDFYYSLLNKERLFAGGPPFFMLPEGRRGFRDYPEMPVFLFSGKSSRDFELFSFYWFISDRMKNVLERVDPEAFVFLKCKVQLKDGADGPVRWLCDIVRVLDALDEGKSEVRINRSDDGTKYYQFGGRCALHFNDDAIGPHHVFRMKFRESEVICDDDFKLACREAGLTGVTFDRARSQPGQRARNPNTGN
jgi:hypothetical protein